MKLNDFAKASYENAFNKGFYDAIAQVHAVSNETLYDALIAQKLALIHSEVSEALEASRTDDKAGLHLPGSVFATVDYSELDEMPDEEFASAYRAKIKDTFEAELAGTLIRVFDLAGWLGVDLDRAVALEMRYNSTRPRKHGKAY
jgi:NTP pyrophosphatase (non-canonical NTP hydrolase)